MTDEASVAITAEYWHMRDLWAVLERQAEINDSTALPNDKYITSMPPQRTDLPISLFRANENESCVALLDGRRRLNLWKSITARYPVLVMSPLKRLPSLGTADHRKARAGVHA